MAASDRPLRVLVYEINEVSWELMQPWLERGDLPSFQRLTTTGSWGRTTADESTDELLNPWVTWTTVYTGVPQSMHGAMFLEQPPESLRVPRLWDLAHQAGRRVGVFASVSSWPPKRVDGFFVPGSFSPDSQTYPESLRPIQDLNLRYTRAHSPTAQKPPLRSELLALPRLVKLGLDVSTLASIVSVLAESKLHPERDWKKVSLQPIVNLAFFRRLFRQQRPDLATFHTNHVAHYQHRFLRAWRPDLFPDPTESREIERFGGAVRYGYRVADRVLGELMRLCDQAGDVVLCVASSMGQQPFVPARHNNVAPPICRLRSMPRLVEILGIADRCEYFSTMAPQWNLRISDSELRARVLLDLKAARYQPSDQGMYTLLEVDDMLVVTPSSRHGLDDSTRCHFPTLPGAPDFPFQDLVVREDATRRSGCHHPIGMLALYGPRIRRGHHLDTVNNLDLAPTLLTLLRVPIPEYMPGRPIAESWDAGVAKAALAATS